jgi:hypothetical protein
MPGAVRQERGRIVQIASGGIVEGTPPDAGRDRPFNYPPIDSHR